MAKTKKDVLPPLVVGKDSKGNSVTISDRTQRLINQVPVSAREEFKQTMVKQALDSAEAKLRYLNRRDDFNIKLTDQGYLAVNGIGTSRSAIFSKQQALVFISRFEEFKAMVNSMPEAPTKKAE